MFANTVFTRRGELYEAALEQMSIQTRPTFDAVRRAISALSFRSYWNDHLHRDQAAAFTVVPDLSFWDWGLGLAIGEALEKVPLLCLSAHCDTSGIVTRISVGTIGGTGATFSIPHEGGYPPLPQQVQAWLRSNNVIVLGSGLTELVEQGALGASVTNYCDTEDYFSYFRQQGLIPCSCQPSATRVDLAAQLAFSATYHHRAGTKQELCDLIRSCNFRGPLPTHRHPDYRISPGLSISPGEKFTIYYDTFGPLYFVLRLLEYGLLFHTVEG